MLESTDPKLKDRGEGVGKQRCFASDGGDDNDDSGDELVMCFNAAAERARWRCTCAKTSAAVAAPSRR